MKTFKNKVRWEFDLSVHGHGRNVKEALRAAVDRLNYQIDSEFSKSDFEAIEEHETVSIVEDDIEE